MQLVAAILMGEPVEQTVFLQPPCQIGEIRLVELNAIVLRRWWRDDAGGIKTPKSPPAKPTSLFSGY
jgi:hypothetical protein